jgi:GNAT superfamily N-acetyltransferase
MCGTRLSTGSPIRYPHTMNLTTRAYDPKRDADFALQLYGALLGVQWPVEPEAFRLRARAGLVACADDTAVGLALIGSERGDVKVQLLLVAEAYQRRGVGSFLHAATLEELRRRGAGSVQLAGGPSYFWAGVPRNLPDAVRFFARQGWDYGEPSWDLVCDLQGYITPSTVVTRGDTPAITCRPAYEHERTSVLQLEDWHFSNWAEYFHGAETGDMVVAVNAEGTVVGALLVEWPGRPFLWSRLLGPSACTIGVVGVDSAARGVGIGTAMLARACELLRDAGGRQCHIGWTSLLSFYGRLGFVPWREYAMSRRDLL